MLKELYLDIKARLEGLISAPSTPLFAEVDLYKNQPATPASITGYPAAYIHFPYSEYKNASAKIQLGDITVKIVLCFEIDSLTNSEDILEVKNLVYEAIQGEYLEAVQPPLPAPRKFYAILNRTMEHTNLQYSGLYLFEMDFYTTIKDFGVYRKKNFVNAGAVDLDIEKDIVQP